MVNGHDHRKKVVISPWQAQEAPKQPEVEGFRADTVYVLKHEGGAVFKGILVYNAVYKNHCLSGIDHADRACHLLFPDIKEHNWKIIQEVKRDAKYEQQIKNKGVH